MFCAMLRNHVVPPTQWMYGVHSIQHFRQSPASVPCNCHWKLFNHDQPDPVRACTKPILNQATAAVELAPFQLRSSLVGYAGMSSTIPIMLHSQTCKAASFHKPIHECGHMCIDKLEVALRHGE